MRQFYSLFFALICVLFLTEKVQAQCTGSASDPNTYVVDLSAWPDTTITLTDITRNPSFCGGNNCAKLIVTVNPQSSRFSFTILPLSNDGKYKIDCGPENNPGSVVCLPSGTTTFCVTYCKNGNNADDIIISVGRGYSVSTDLKLRTGNSCTGLMTVSGLQESTIVWRSVFPGASGQYNGYLSCTTGC